MKRKENRRWPGRSKDLHLGQSVSTAGRARTSLWHVLLRGTTAVPPSQQYFTASLASTQVSQKYKSWILFNTYLLILISKGDSLSSNYILSNTSPKPHNKAKYKINSKMWFYQWTAPCSLNANLTLDPLQLESSCGSVANCWILVRVKRG